LSDELNALRSIEHKLDDILKWTRLAGMQQLRSILTQSLTTDRETLVFEFSDGERGTREIGSIAGVSNATVANYWRKWSRLGIVEPSSRYQGRFRKICSLEEVGLTAPPSIASEAVSQENESGSEEIVDERGQ
jgi:DNA-binding CsgD family transcriptional regulator